MNGKVRKSTIEEQENCSKPKLSSKNIIKGINTCAVLLAKYSGPFLKWTKEEL